MDIVRLASGAERDVLGHEVSVRDGGVSGRIDSLVRTETGGGPIEFKSVDSMSFRYGDYPRPAHVLQVAMYLVYGIYREGLIAYLGKQDARVEEYTVEWTPELDEFVRGYIHKLDGYLKDYRENGTLPPALEVPKSDWRIRFCDLKGTGWCCGDPTDVTETTDRARDPDPPHSNPPGLPGLLRVGGVELEAPRAQRQRRKSRKTEGPGLEKRMAQEVTQERAIA